ncbi:MAG: penicillin acylase family protein [Janthinobacterium lividum]
MSRFDDEQQPDPAEIRAERESEPRLLTRPEQAISPERERKQPQRRREPQHAAMNGLVAWARSLTKRRQRPEPIKERRYRWFWWVAAMSVVVALVSALVMAFDLRHALTASLPQIDGEAHIAGLHAPVTVTRDAQGVPSITAASLDDLLFAQGYTTAGDRLWQMDALRRHSAGELADILGSGLVEHDRRQRYLQIRAAADRAAAQLPADQREQLEAYARGVNAFIDTHRHSLPVEFHLLAYSPAPWTPRDSLLVSMAMFQDLSTEFPQKLNRELLSAHLPANLLNDLYPVGSWRDQPPASQARSISAPHVVEQIPLDPSQAGLQSPQPPAANPQDLLAVSASLAGTSRCEGCRSGSNNWVVSGAHTASHAPLVSNDMHLSLTIPDIWYEAGLHTDLPEAGTRLDVVGFTLPGVPFVVVGRNAHVAWGVTNLGADVQDVRVEHLRGTGDTTEFERPDGSWTTATHHPERIRVRGGLDVVLDVMTTTHAVGATAMETPIISPLYHSEQRALSLAWTAYDPTAVSWAHLGVDTATDGPSLEAALSDFGGPSLNLVWADSAGHIGYHALGRIPVRGPAVKHPRVTSEIVPETPTPGLAPEPTPENLPTNEEDQGTPAPDGPSPSPQAELSTGPHFVLSAFHPVRRRRFVARNPAPAAAPARGRRRPSRRQPEPEQVPMAQQALPPALQPLNYSIGSPISPLPVDALDASQEWSGYIAFADLPSVTDPAGGFLATANSRITPNDYPWAVANDWVDPFRAERLVHMLSGRNDLTAADMLRMQNDVHSDVNQNIAQRLAYAIDHASAAGLGSDAPRLRQAANVLRSWDGNMRVASSGAAMVAAVRDVLWPSLLIPQILHHDGHGLDPKVAAKLAQLYTWNERTTALDVLLQHQAPRWLPAGYSNWNDFLAAVTERGLHTAGAPNDLTHWVYGSRHTVQIAHPIFGDQPLISKLLGITGTTGAQPAPGDGTTVKAIGTAFGPSERFTADLSSPETAFGNITTGESGNAKSSWFLDQFQPWLKGSTFDLSVTQTRSTHTLRLLPE